MVHSHCTTISLSCVLIWSCIFAMPSRASYAPMIRGTIHDLSQPQRSRSPSTRGNDSSTFDFPDPTPLCRRTDPDQCRPPRPWNKIDNHGRVTQDSWLEMSDDDVDVLVSDAVNQGRQLKAAMGKSDRGAEHEAPYVHC